MMIREAIPLMLRSSGSGWATREMGTTFTMGGASYLPWLAGSLEEYPGEGYWLSFNQRLPISYELGDCLYGLLHHGQLVWDEEDVEGEIVIGAGLWSASLGLSLQPKRPCVSLFGTVPARLEPSTGLLGLIRHLGVVSWSMG